MEWPNDLPRRGAATKDHPFRELGARVGGWHIGGEPYTTAGGSSFMWWRARMVGGRTNRWGRISLRFGRDAFRRRTLDGSGDDWPISYDVVAPEPHFVRPPPQRRIFERGLKWEARG